MSYSFKATDSSISEGVRRIAAAQIDRALRECRDGDLAEDERLHQLRKRCKKLRGLVRLVRPEFDRYKAENAAFRDAARALAPMRDADVAVGTFDKIAGELRAGSGNISSLRQVLTSSAAETAETVDARQRLEAFAAAMAEARSRVGDWAFDLEDHALPGGLAKTYGRARDAMANAAKHPTPARLHEWRKRVKYHWYHARLLKRTAPVLIAPHRKLASKLGEILGDHNDLAALAEHLASLDDLDSSPTAEAALKTVKRRRRHLADKAFTLGELLFAEEEKAFARRFGCYWDHYWARVSPHAPARARKA